MEIKITIVPDNETGCVNATVSETGTVPSGPAARFAELVKKYLPSFLGQIGQLQGAQRIELINESRTNVNN